MKLNLMAALLAAAAPAWAQQKTETIVVTGNPFGQAEVATPSSVLSGDALTLRRGGSLGETLDGLPGVASTYFGPNANRPVIRGQDGDRIRVLNNAGASLDASSLSFDHAVPIDPLLIERVEVLRGPAALVFGGSAVGGVVNVIDNRIPKDRVDGVGGAVEMRLGGAARERAASALVEAGSARFALHADAFSRATEDLQVPAFNRLLPDGDVERRTRIVNSASRAYGGAVGASTFWDHGMVGASVDSYRNDYGIVVEDDITIQMRRDKFTLAGELRVPNGFFGTLRARAASTDYQHQEVEGDGAVGTTFKTRGSDARLEAVHRAIPMAGGRLEGSVGVQLERSRFSALGEEAFVPSTHTRQDAAFVLERWSRGDQGHLSAGMRAERVRVRSEGDANEAEPQFGPAQARQFTLSSASLGGVWNLDPRWQLSANASYTERAPTSYELYANGVHAATGVFERGDPAQVEERGRNLDVSLAWRDGEHHVRLGGFVSRFSNYIALMATGEPDLQLEDGQYPVYAFRGVAAELHGWEIEGSWRVVSGRRTVDLDAKLDVVRGQNRVSGDVLPRLAPQRLTVGIQLNQGAWQARAEVQHAQTQRRVPQGETSTDGWTQVHLSVSYRIDLGGRDALLFLKLNNAGDSLAYNASSLSTMRALVPLPGRSAIAGLRLTF